MNRKATSLELLRALVAQPGILRARPSLIFYLCRYMRKFRIRNAGGRLFIHSHLPPINSRAYRRFIGDHLLSSTVRPSHAQIGVTNACPQRCSYCYNKTRSGRPLTHIAQLAP